jgi:hypothetical protein
MPRTRLVSVAKAISPDDFNICDIARDSKATARPAKAEKLAEISR